jgi:hypothetical protein
MNSITPTHAQIEMTCPQCLRNYILGKTGTIYGCDPCEGIVRDAKGMIIPSLCEPLIKHVEKTQTKSFITWLGEQS